MLRKLLILSVCAGSSASLPLIYQNHPQLFHDILRSAATSDEEAKPLSVLAVSPRTAQADLPGRKVEISPDARGHFLAEFKVNGRRVAAMIDTGATLVALNRSTARSLGITLAASDFKYKVDTANGSARAASVVIADIDIGRIHVENVEAVVLEDGALQNILIGMSFLQKLDKYAVQNGTMLLMQ